MYYKERPEDNTYARPVEGIRVVVDLLNQCVGKWVCGCVWMCVGVCGCACVR